MNWQQMNNARKKHIRFGERLFGRMYANIRKELSRRLERVETQAEIEGAVTDMLMDEDIDDAFDVFYRTVGVDFAKRTYRGMKSADGREVKEDLNQLEPMWEQLMALFVVNECSEKIKQIKRTMRLTYGRILDQTVERGMNEGWGVKKIASEILKEGTRKEKWQAMRIARTEVLSASNYGSATGAESTGTPMMKKWLHSPSPEPREDHLAMAGTSVEYEQDFILPSGVNLFLPGDPSGPPEEIINCRCGVSFEPKQDIIQQILES